METSQTRAAQNNMASQLSSTVFQASDLVRLYQSTFIPTPNSTKADFDANRIAAADMADVATTLNWLYGVDQTGRALLISAELLSFFPAGTATFPFIAGGWYIVDSTDTKLLAHGVFDTPVTFDSAADQFLLKPDCYFDALCDADEEFIDAP